MYNFFIYFLIVYIIVIGSIVSWFIFQFIHERKHLSLRVKKPQ